MKLLTSSLCVFVPLLTLGLACLGGCSEDAQPSSPATEDGGTAPDSAPASQREAGPGTQQDAGSDAAADAGQEAGACNDLVNSASVVTAKAVVGSLPVGTGGVIPEGLYHLTDMIYYVDEAPPTPLTETWQQTLEIKNGDVSLVSRRNNNEQRGSVKFVVTGNTVTIEQSCPEPRSAGPFEFAVTGNELRIVGPNDGRVTVMTLVE